MDPFIHTFISIGALALSFYTGRFLLREAVVKYLLESLEQDGFIRIDNEELVPISEIIREELQKKKEE
jgi:hypothetical protein